MTRKSLLAVVLMTAVGVSGYIVVGGGSPPVWAVEPEPSASAKDPAAGALVPEPAAYQPRPSAIANRAKSRVLARLEAQLQKPVDPTVFPETTTLDAFAKRLSAWLRLPVRLHQNALDEIGLDEGASFNVKLRSTLSGDAGLRSALRQSDAELTWVVDNEIMVITTTEAAEMNPIVKFYDVGDIVGCEDDVISQNCDFDPVIELIVTTVYPDSWDEAGGAAQMTEFEAAGVAVVCVSSSRKAHQEIESLLASVRRMRHTGVGILYPMHTGFVGNANLVAAGEQTSSPAKTSQARCGENVTPLPEIKPTVAIGRAERPAEKKIMAALDKPVDLAKLVGKTLTLAKVTELLSKQAGTPIQFDVNALDELGIGADVQVRLDWHHAISLKSVLRHILHDVDQELTFMIKNEVLTITTKEVESYNLVTRLYDVTDLTATCVSESGSLNNDFSQLIDLVSTMIEGDHWEEAGGAGQIAEMTVPGIRALVISVREDMHEGVADLLHALRSMRHEGTRLYECNCGLAAKDAETAGRSVTGQCASGKDVVLPKPKATVTFWQGDEEKHMALRAALDKVIDVSDLEGETTLKEVVATLAKKMNVHVELDAWALDELGMGPDTPLAFDWPKSVSVRSVLRITLNRIDPEVTFMIRDEAIVITTKEVESENLVTRFYDVADICAGCVLCNGAVDYDFDPMIELITTTVEPDTWEEAGGAGRVSEFRVNGVRAIVASTTWDEHRQVEAVIESVRNFRHENMMLPSCSQGDYEVSISVEGAPETSQSDDGKGKSND